MRNEAPAPTTAPARSTGLAGEYTVTHAVRTARTLGMRPSVLLEAFLDALEHDGRADVQRVAQGEVRG